MQINRQLRVDSIRNVHVYYYDFETLYDLRDSNETWISKQEASDHSEGVWSGLKVITVEGENLRNERKYH